MKRRRRSRRAFLQFYLASRVQHLTDPGRPPAGGHHRVLRVRQNTLPKSADSLSGARPFLAAPTALDARVSLAAFLASVAPAKMKPISPNVPNPTAAGASGGANWGKTKTKLTAAANLGIPLKTEWVLAIEAARRAGDDLEGLAERLVKCKGARPTPRPRARVDASRASSGERGNPANRTLFAKSRPSTTIEFNPRARYPTAHPPPLPPDARPQTPTPRSARARSSTPCASTAARRLPRRTAGTTSPSTPTPRCAPLPDSIVSPQPESREPRHT